MTWTPPKCCGGPPGIGCPIPGGKGGPRPGIIMGGPPWPGGGPLPGPMKPGGIGGLPGIITPCIGGGPRPGIMGGGPIPGGGGRLLGGIMPIGGIPPGSTGG